LSNVSRKENGIKIPVSLTKISVTIK